MIKLKGLVKEAPEDVAAEIEKGLSGGLAISIFILK